jgi:hypothetical protein
MLAEISFVAALTGAIIQRYITPAERRVRLGEPTAPALDSARRPAGGARRRAGADAEPVVDIGQV